MPNLQTISIWEVVKWNWLELGNCNQVLSGGLKAFYCNNCGLDYHLNFNDADAWSTLYFNCFFSLIA